MNLVVFACLSIFFGLHMVWTSVDKHNACEDNVCFEKDRNESEELSSDAVNSSISEEFSSGNLSKNLNLKEIFLIKNLENSSVENVNYTVEKFSAEKGFLLETFEEDSNISTSHNVTEGVFYNTSVSVPDTSEVTSSSTWDTTTTKSTTKSNMQTTETPISGTHSPFIIQNFDRGKKICSCDIKVNQCDINCCCDEDCMPSHFKIFTKCIDNEPYDSRYCYNTNFIFGNNTSNQIVKKNEGLFCIVKENLKVDFLSQKHMLLTSLEAFNKSLPKNMYFFYYKSSRKSEFASKFYKAGSSVWIVQNEEVKLFKIPHSSIGHLCNSKVNVKYLVDETTVCFIQQGPNGRCGDLRIKNMLQYLRNIKVIGQPNLLNISQPQNFSKICKAKACVEATVYLCELFADSYECLKISPNKTNFSEIGCWNILSNVKYRIWHNGSEGISKMETYVWVKKLSEISGEHLSPLITEVEYLWVNTTDKVFRRSGNPGYLTGKPILAGRKIYDISNGTTFKKEAIELSLDPKDWLNVLGSKRGICSSDERIPIYFRDNSQFTCSLKLSKTNFTKEKCQELQNNIFQLLIGNDVINSTKESYLNKFVATFGNSRVEETSDWVRVLIDLFPVMSNQASFKSNHYHLICKNIITDLHINIVYSNIGSFLAPQAKILGVSFHFGKHKDLVYNCYTPNCENSSFTQYTKLSSTVHFIDVTKPAVDSFAEPLRLEAKLPHDFFYPFFSKSCRSAFLSKSVLILTLISLF